MRGIWKVLLVLGLLGGVVAGAAGAFVAWQVGMAAPVGRPQPEPMTAAELLEKGPGDNGHLLLTEFTFGKPVLEIDQGRWRRVWVPIVPAGQQLQASKKMLFFQAIGVTDTAQLNAALNQTTLDVLVANRLPDGCLWKGEGRDLLWKTYPKAAPDAVLFLTEPQLRLGGRTLLAGDRVCEPMVQHLGWGVAGGAGVLALVCLILLRRRGDRPSAETQAERDRVAAEFPVSSHGFNIGNSLFMSLLYLAGAAGAGYFATLAAPFTITLWTTNLLIGAALSALATVAGFAVAAAGALWVIGSILNGVWTIEVCRSGLRWAQCGRTQHRAWSEVASVDRQDHQQLLKRQTGDVLLQWSILTIQFHSGEKLRLASYEIADYEGFYNALETNRGAQLNTGLVVTSRNSVLNPTPPSRPSWVNPR
jgi:hypothetical protein